MKATFITDEASQSVAEFTRLAHSFDISTVELRSVQDEPVFLGSRRYIRDLISNLLHAGLSVCCLDTPIFKCAVDAPIDVELEKLRRALDACASLGAPYVRIFSFWNTRSPQRQQVISDAFVRAHEIARDADVKLLVENGRRTCHRSGGELASLLRTLCATCFGALWDPGNSFLSGSDLDPLKNGYPKIRDRTAHVHLKDPRIRGHKREYVALGTGQLHAREHVKALHADGYTGLISLETHWRPNVRLEAKTLDVPYGSKFSRGGYAATRQCLQVLSTWLNEI